MGTTLTRPKMHPSLSQWIGLSFCGPMDRIFKCMGCPVFSNTNFLVCCSVSILLSAQCIWGNQRFIRQLRRDKCYTIQQRWKHFHSSLHTRPEVLHLWDHVSLSWRDEASSICQWRPGAEPWWCTPGPWVQWSGPNFFSSAPFQQYQQPIACCPFGWISV